MDAQTVFVVDDGAAMRTLLSQMVKQLGRIPVVFDSGPKLLEAIKTVRPDLVLIDLNMHPMMGNDTCRAVKQKLGGTPVMMMTAGSESADVQTCHEAGADDFLPKPIWMHQLARKLEALNAPATLGQRRIVVVEPDEQRSDKLCEKLSLAGYAVMPTSSRSLALAHLRRQEADLLLLGVGVPASGTADLMWLAQVQPGLKVVRATRVRNRDDEALVAQGATLVLLETPNFDDELVMRIDALFNPPNKRAWERTPFFSVAQFCSYGAEWSSGYTSDIGEGGLCVRTLNPLPPNTPVQVKLTLSSKQQAVMNGNVVWARAANSQLGSTLGPGMGIRVRNLDPRLQPYLKPSLLSP